VESRDGAIARSAAEGDFEGDDEGNFWLFVAAFD
jgi:hypothetical protein